MCVIHNTLIIVKMYIFRIVPGNPENLLYSTISAFISWLHAYFGRS